MAAFDEDAFSINAFSTDSFDFGAGPGAGAGSSGRARRRRWFMLGVYLLLMVGL